MKNKGSKKIILFYLVFFLAIIFVANMFVGSNSKQENIEYGKVVQMFQNKQVKSFYVDDKDYLYLSVNAIATTTDLNSDAFEYVHHLANTEQFNNDLGALIMAQTADGTLVRYDFKAITPSPWWMSYLPYLIVVVILIVIFVMFVSKSSKGGNGGGGFGRMNSFSKARTKLGSDEKKKVLFTDVAGADEEKEELQEVVDFLRNPNKFSDLGARIPKGVLLVGSPGTGKTLLAKAVAGESGVPFYSISGSDFVEMYVGVGASRVRDLFETAKKTAPCIIFIDEIDAVGRHRGAGLGGGHDEREQTLNQLLVEMDGFGVNDGVIVIAATNRPDILDPALLRPGRFDRQVTVNLPDIKGREEILKVHSRGKPMGNDVDLATIAKSTAGFSGADLANLLNEAALHAARKKKTVINTDDIEEATIKVIVGPQKKSLVMTNEEKRKTAFHEAGHAIVTRMLGTQDPVHSISIIPSGRALGYTLSLPEKDKFSVYKNELLDNICVLMGGRAAEKLMCDDISGGASNDMERATEIARKMVTKLGMSDILGPVVYSSENSEVFLGKDFGTTKNYSEQIAVLIDEEVRKFVTGGYERAIKILEDNMPTLIFIAEYLVKHEIMDAEQFELCFKEGVTEEMLDAVTERKKQASAEENEARKQELKKAKKARENEEKEVSENIVNNDNVENVTDESNNVSDDSDDDNSDSDIFSDDILKR
ncbi:MAG: ATP-dependent zinc metalloprotease FtsH [Clostridia bacterium]|nr:ATP-dependent zinc metalloprotease FtsH [Clostridia bacterium]